MISRKGSVEDVFWILVIVFVICLIVGVVWNTVDEEIDKSRLQKLKINEVSMNFNGVCDLAGEVDGYSYEYWQNSKNMRFLRMVECNEPAITKTYYDGDGDNMIGSGFFDSYTITMENSETSYYRDHMKHVENGETKTSKADHGMIRSANENFNGYRISILKQHGYLVN